MQIRPFKIEDEQETIDLWVRCGLTRPWNDPSKDIACKMAVNPEWFLVGEIEGRIMASVMAGYDGHRGWVYYLGIDPGFQKSGYGRQMMAAAEDLLKKAGCPKINLMVRTSNKQMVAFYQNLGFEVDDVIGMGKRL